MAIVVNVTVPSDKAQELAKAILEQRLCACINIVGGVESHFWWNGKIDTVQESILIIKTKDALFPKLKVFVENNHPYDIPEVIAFKIDQINTNYMEWLNREASATPFA